MIIPIFPNWRWSNAPDGERPVEKIVSLSKYGLFGGTGIGAYDIIMLSQTKTIAQSLNCMAYWLIPLTSMCATFATVTYMSTNLRGKDDKLNYIVGSFVTSGIFHVWQKHTFSSCMFALALSAASCIVKDSRQNNWTLLELPPTPAKATYFYKDWTLLKDPRPWKN